MTSAIQKPTVAILAGFMLAASLTACNRTDDVTSLRIQPPSYQRSAEATEPVYYNGTVYRFQLPSSASNDQNELIVLGCFRAGPDFTDHAHNATSATLYALFLPGADQHACPDGTQAHDHIVSAVPGAPGYATLWNLKAVVPGPAFDQSIMPITSERALLNAEALGQVVIIDTGVPLKGVIVGPR
jgi:hypothetical protein